MVYHFTGLWTCDETRGLNSPGSLAGCPEFIEIFEVALGIHASPETAMLEHAEVPITGEADQRISLQNTILLRRKIGQEITVKEEVSTINPTIAELRLLTKLLNLCLLDSELPTPRGWVDSEDS